jgi:hypothetical protein
VRVDLPRRITPGNSAVVRHITMREPGEHPLLPKAPSLSGG